MPIAGLIKRLVKGSAITAAEHDANLTLIETTTDALDASKADNGANSDITSLSGLTTPLSIPQGGTGSATASDARTALGVAIGSDVQAYDAQLADVAGLTPTDGNIIIGDGANFITESGATARTSLGLAIGSDVEAYDATILKDADIGVTVQAYDVDTAKLDVAQEWTQAQNFNATALSDGATINWDAEANQVCSVTLAGNRTMANPTNVTDGGFYSIMIVQDATGSRTLTWGANYQFTNQTAPTLTTTALVADIIVFRGNSSGKLKEVGRSLNIG